MSSPVLICGIDPGKSGAIAFLDPVHMALTVHDMPMGKSSTGRDELDLRRLGEILNPPVSANRFVGVLERVRSMPTDGAAGAFSFGEGYGALRMALIGLGYEDRYVTPVTWKKHFKLSKDKGVSRSYAATRFPGYSGIFARVKDDGRAEAALIALYGAEVMATQISQSLLPTS